MGVTGILQGGYLAPILTRVNAYVTRKLNADICGMCGNWTFIHRNENPLEAHILLPPLVPVRYYMLVKLAVGCAKTPSVAEINVS